MSGLTVWFTGLSGAGKSSVAYRVAAGLQDLGRHTIVLDGDHLRRGLNADLGYCMTDRTESQRRIAHLACLLSGTGLVVLVATISPLTAHRALARSIHDQANVAFREVYVDTPLAVCERRDPQGLYARARRGDLHDFTGVGSDYEPPTHPDLRLPYGRPMPELAQRVVSFIEETASV